MPIQLILLNCFSSDIFDETSMKLELDGRFRFVTPLKKCNAKNDATIYCILSTIKIHALMTKLTEDQQVHQQGASSGDEEVGQDILDNFKKFTVQDRKIIL